MSYSSYSQVAKSQAKHFEAPWTHEFSDPAHFHGAMDTQNNKVPTYNTRVLYRQEVYAVGVVGRPTTTTGCGTSVCLFVRRTHDYDDGCQ